MSKKDLIQAFNNENWHYLSNYSTNDLINKINKYPELKETKYFYFIYSILLWTNGNNRLARKTFKNFSIDEKINVMMNDSIYNHCVDNFFFKYFFKKYLLKMPYIKTFVMFYFINKLKKNTFLKKLSL
jgi:hypothetical protein